MTQNTTKSTLDISRKLFHADNNNDRYYLQGVDMLYKTYMQDIEVSGGL